MDIRGSVNETDLIDVIRFLESMKVSGCLAVKSKNQVDIVFKDGLVIGALTTDEEMDILDQIASIKEGSYSFAGRTENDHYKFKEIKMPSDRFYGELSRRVKESIIDPELYQDDMIFELVPASKVSIFTFSPDEWRVIAMLSEKESIGKIRCKVGLEKSSIRTIMYTLEQAGLIKRVRTTRQALLGASIISRIRKFLGRFSV